MITDSDVFSIIYDQLDVKEKKGELGKYPSTDVYAASSDGKGYLIKIHYRLIRGQKTPVTLAIYDDGDMLRRNPKLIDTYPIIGHTTIDIVKSLIHVYMLQGHHQNEDAAIEVNKRNGTIKFINLHCNPIHEYTFTIPD